MQWLLLMGTSFVVSAYLQVVRGYDAIQTGVIFTAATVGILVSSLAAERLAKRRPQRTLIAGRVRHHDRRHRRPARPGRRHTDRRGRSPRACSSSGSGSASMLTPSVNVVQSAFPEDQQGEISGLSRSVSNLGSSLGTAVAGTILVAGLTDARAPTRWPWSSSPSSASSGSRRRCCCLVNVRRPR